MSRLLCVGECMLELSERADGSIAKAFGGDSLNTAVYAARSGVDVAYLTALGDDPFSADMVAAWDAEGVDTGLVRRTPGRVPGLYWIKTDAAGERSFSYWRDQAPYRDLFRGRSGAGALADMRTMLGDDERTRLGQVVHLTRRVIERHTGRQRVAASRTDRWKMVDYLVGVSSLPECLTLVAFLPARLFGGAPAQAGHPHRLPQPVARWGLTTVVAVQAEPALELADPGLQRRNLCGLRLY